MTKRRRSRGLDFSALEEHKLMIGMVLCLALAGSNYLFGGGGNALNRKFALQSQDESLLELKDRTKAAQKAAEEIFASQGATAQVLSRATRTTNLISGETVIDPASITRQNPEGTEINGGFVVSRDGSIFSVDSTGKTTLIGTSPNIRNTIVKNGMAQGAAEMQANAQRLARQLSLPTRNTDFPIQANP